MAILKKILLAGLVLAVLACGVVLYAVSWLNQWAEAPMRLQQDQVLNVPPGSSLYRLSIELEQLGLIEQGRYLRWYIKLNKLGHFIQAGEYAVPQGTTPHQLIARIQKGDVIQYSVTLINGQTFGEFLQTLRADPVLIQRVPDMTHAQILAALQEERTHPEGLFYPDTYHYRRGDSDLDILRRAHGRMAELLARAWDQRQEGLPYKDAYEALIMASIVEKETAVGEERALIAGVFVNRLNKKMRLQTDPTVIYGLGDQYQGNITRAHLKAYSPYNTYRINGLPPTPIANPALPAIEAALHPATTNALYFVAKGDGSHHFSETLQEHTKAVRQYQWKRRADYRSSPQ
ncbi:endolytic transglycosylase MltG [Ketobacter sp.]|uniref:endolytic transglycosylase MltG n=1 Tax=Ketobacter sp. TaxID=2083498 RepID=UPI0025B7C937|nr:endolytic transglycosylase MltG [Ketobacter sp.]